MRLPYVQWDKIHATFGSKRFTLIEAPRFWICARSLVHLHAQPGIGSAADCLLKPYIRVAEHAGRLYLDLADKHWRAVAIAPMAGACLDARQSGSVGLLVC